MTTATAARLPSAPPHRPRPVTRFELPADRVATRPIEDDGRERDGVRLLVARPHGTEDRPFRDLPRLLHPGDLLVVNTSGAVPSALPARRADGRAVVVHLAGPARPAPEAEARSSAALGARWVVELRHVDGGGPQLDGQPRELLRTASGARITLVSPVDPRRSRLWEARVAVDGEVVDHLRSHGRPIAYGYLERVPASSAYTTVLGHHPGSAEMPSAGRPLTHRVIADLVVRGVTLAPVLLHAGVSSLEVDESPPAERFAVPAVTARLVEHTRRHGGRVVALGTTVTRALESAVDADGRCCARSGWTDLVLGPDRPAQVVDGLVTGWHEPEASHLLLLEAVAGADLVARAYAAGLAAGHRWHEFGDTCLLLP